MGPNRTSIRFVTPNYRFRSDSVKSVYAMIVNFGKDKPHDTYSTA